MTNILRLPLRGQFQDNLYGRLFRFSYNTKLDKLNKTKYVHINFQISDDSNITNNISLDLHKIPIKELTSKDGHNCNILISIGKNPNRIIKIINIKQIIEIEIGQINSKLLFKLDEVGQETESPFYKYFKDTPNFENLGMDSFEELEGGKVENILKNLTIEFEKYLDSLTSLSPARITGSTFEAGIKIFHTILKIVGQSKYDSPELNQAIFKWCNFLKNNYDNEMENIIITGNKITTSVQILQEKIESVADGEHWKNVFLSDFNINDTNNKNQHHTTYVNENDDEIHVHTSDENINNYTHDKHNHSDYHIKNKQKVKYYQTNDYIDNNIINNEPNDIRTNKKYTDSHFNPSQSQNMISYINAVNQTYNSIHGKEPDTDTLLYYVTLLKNKGINQKDLYKLVNSNQI